MPIDTNLVLKQIRNIRKSKRLRVKDCAKVLGVSKEKYREIEAGDLPISLPELELLAFYLGVSPTALLENDQSLASFSNLLHDDIRLQYLTLRRKMIGALIFATRENENAYIEELQQATQIPLDRLYAYEKGDIPIPLSDLSLISSYLEISHNALCGTVWLDDSNLKYPPQESDWQAELSDGETVPEDDVFSDLLQAFKQLSPADQAQIAKEILERLKT